MKSSVASRKQRFWALLLAVVMAVGLLPTAGVKADPTIVEIKPNLDDFAKVGKIFSAEDGFEGSYEIEEDAGNLYVSYHDVSGVYLSGGAITENMNDGDEEEPKWIRQTSSGNTYYIYSYEDVADVSEGELYTDPQDYDAHVTDKWLVYPGEDDDIDEYGEYDQVIHLRAIPRYTIKWYPILDEVEWNPDWETFPNEYIPYVPDSQPIDLTKYTGEKEGYKFIGWDHLGDTEEDGQWEATYKNNHGTIIDSDTCEKFDSYYIEVDDEDPEEVIEEEIHSYAIRLRARWIPYYTIKYEKGTTPEICNEIEDPAIDPQEVEMPWLMAEEYEEGSYDEDTDIVELNSDGYSRPGYVFNGWLRYNDKTQQYVPVDYTIEADQDMDPGEELVLYADWVPTYKITFDNNLPEVENYNDKDSIPVPTPISGQVPTDQSDPWIEMPGEPSNDAGDLQHYHLENWYIEGTSAKFARNTNYRLISQLLEASEGLLTFTMKGEWIPNEYTFSFHPNRDGVDQPEDINGPYNKVEDIAIPDLAQYENDNLEFIGWVFDPDNVTDDTLITGTKTMKEIVDIYDAEVKRYEKEHLSDFDGQPEVIYEYPWENDNGGVFLTGIWKESYTIKFHKGYQIYHDLGDPKISDVQGIMPGDNDTEEITFVYNPDSTEVFNPYNFEDKFGYSLQGFYYDWEVHEVLLKGEPDGAEGYNWFKEGNTTYVLKEGFSDYNPTREDNTTYGKLSEYAKKHADEDNVLHIVAWWNRDNAAYKITFDNMDPSKDINKATIPATDPILGYYWNTVDEQAEGGMPQDPPTGGNEQAETYVYIPPVVVNPNVNDPFGTVEMPMAPQSEKHDPRYYNFLGWKIKKETDEAEDEEIKLYSPQQSYHVKDLFEEAGLTWVSTYKIDPDLYSSQMFDDENYYLDVIPMEAVWEAKTYDIIFDANKGDKDITLNPTSLEEYNLNGVRFTETKAITYPDLKDANDNYGVIGWVLDSTGTTKDFPINAEDKVKDIVLKADVLDDNGDSKYIKIIDLGADPAVGGDNDNELQSDGQITLYALWEKYITVTYDANGANAGNVPEIQKGFSDEKVKAAGNTGNLTKDGYTFAGWNTSETGENGTAYAVGADIALNSGNVVLYAQWSENEPAELEFYPNGGDINSEYNEIGYYIANGPEGSILNAPGEEVVTKKGFVLAGWGNEGSEDVIYEPGDPINLYTGELYAIWEPMESYIILFDLNAPDDMIVKPTIEIELQTGTYSVDSRFNLYDIYDYYDDYELIGWGLIPGNCDYSGQTNIKKLVDDAVNYGEVDFVYPTKESEVKNGLVLYGYWEKRNYTVTFYDADGEEISSEEYVYGTEVKDIDIPDDLDYETIAIKYVFTGWDKEVVDVKADAEYTAQYDEIDKKYDFIFVSNEQGLDLTTDDDSTLGECRYYQYPIWLPELKDSTNKYKVYGWGFNTKDKAFEPDLQVFLSDVIDGAVAAGTIIEPDAEHENYRIKLYALWTDKPLHNVIWQDGNGKVLFKKENVPEGTENPDDFEGELPSIDDDQYAYDLEWEEYEDGTDDVVYRPKFVNPTVKIYTVTFVDEDGTTVLKAAAEYEYGTIAADIAKPTPTKDGYDFAGWDPEVKTVTKDATYKAKYTAKQFGVKFIDYDNREINETQYTYGTKAADIVKPADPTRAGYTFTGWTPAIADVTGNATYTATYVQNASGGNDNPVVKYWTITWKNYDGKGSETTTQVKEGDVPAYNGTPSKAEDNAYTYTFKGWTPAVVAATADATYTAEFTGSAKQNNNNNNVTTPTPTPEPTPEPTPTPTPSAPAEYDIEYYEEFPDGTAVLLKKTNNPDKYTYGVGAEIKYGIDKEGYKFNGWYSKRSKKYVTKIGTTTKGTVKLYARFVPVDDGNGEGGDNGSGTPASDFGTLFVRLTEYTEDSMKLVWELMDGVDGYDIFGSRCNSADVIRPYEPIASVEGDISEYEMENLLAKTYYKFYVRAYILVNGEKRYITTSINVHGVTLNDKYGVADDINIEKVVVKYTNGKSKTKYNRADDGDVEELNITMKVGQTLKIVASEYNADGKEIRAHRPISFESSNTNICKIGTRAKHKYGIEVKDKANTYKSYSITAKAEGECTIYVFAQNGIYTKVNVTVKAAK